MSIKKTSQHLVIIVILKNVFHLWQFFYDGSKQNIFLETALGHILSLKLLGDMLGCGDAGVFDNCSCLPQSSKIPRRKWDAERGDLSDLLLFVT